MGDPSKSSLRNLPPNEDGIPIIPDDPTGFFGEIDLDESFSTSDWFAATTADLASFNVDAGEDLDVSTAPLSFAYNTPLFGAMAYPILSQLYCLTPPVTVGEHRGLCSSGSPDDLIYATEIGSGTQGLIVRNGEQSKLCVPTSHSLPL